MALSFVCILVAEVFGNGEDENPILNRGEYFEHHLHIIVVRNISNNKKRDIEVFFSNKHLNANIIFIHYYYSFLGSDAKLFEGDILLPVS